MNRLKVIGWSILIVFLIGSLLVSTIYEDTTTHPMYRVDVLSASTRFDAERMLDTYRMIFPPSCIVNIHRNFEGEVGEETYIYTIEITNRCLFNVPAPKVV